MAGHGVAPVGVAPIRHDIPRLQHGRQIVEDGVDRVAGRHVQQHHAWRGEDSMQVTEPVDPHQARGQQVVGRPAAVEACDTQALLQAVSGQVAADPAETDDREIRRCAGFLAVGCCHPDSP